MHAQRSRSCGNRIRAGAKRPTHLEVRRTEGRPSKLMLMRDRGGIQMRRDLLEDIGGVPVLRWRPHRPYPWRPRRLFRFTKSLPYSPTVDNFGDLVGPLLVRELTRDVPPRRRPEVPPRRLLTVGSVLHWARDTDVVWGSGVNGKHLDLVYPPGPDLRAVRGPLTADFLRVRGHHPPEVFGDPALLLPDVLPKDRLPIPLEPGRPVFVPNLNDTQPNRLPTAEVLSLAPTRPVMEVLGALAHASLVVGTSLHAIIVAEAYGVPARLVTSPTEPPFKYLDYYEGTGRSDVAVATQVNEALDMGGVSPWSDWDSSALRSAFPFDLWG